MNKLKKFLTGGGAIVLLLAALETSTSTLSVVAEEGDSVNTSTNSNTVEGITPKGVTFDLFDYWLIKQDSADNESMVDYPELKNAGINNGHVLKFGKGMNESNTGSAINEWTGEERYTETTTPSKNAPYTGIVEKKLLNGYPQLNSIKTGSSESLAYLFSPLIKNDYKASYSNVTGLLQLSNGYYYYTSHETANDTLSNVGATSGNFAEFNKDTNSFTLYDTWGVEAGGSSPNGQFFPFNSKDDVFATTSSGKLTQNGIESTASKINHYFGMHMKSYFVQPENGETNGKDMVFEFSGDDDVWIYIDGALVGDLGGIHDECSISINFASGEVKIYKNVSGKNKKQVGTTTTLRALFEAAGVTLADSAWAGGTFAKDTYHTLDMFYLERGNTDSNLSLKFNLVPPPESDIIKVDQSGAGVPGATFKLYEAKNSTYELASEPTLVAEGTTNADGEMVLTDPNTGTVVNFDNRFLTGSSNYYVLEEITAPDGYRAINEDVHLHYVHNSKLGSGVLECENVFDSGVWSGPKEAVTIQDVTQMKSDESGETTIDFNEQDDTIYTVIFKRTKNIGQTPTENDGWQIVSGNVLTGLTFRDVSELKTAFSEATDKEAAGFYAFTKNTEGKYSVTMEEMPGDIEKYYHWIEGETNGDLTKSEYSIGFFVYDKSADELVRINTASDLENYTRQFGSRLYITDVRNSLVVQKVDWDTANNADVEGRQLGITGATFELYEESQVSFDSEGKATVKGNPYRTGKTTDLVKGQGGSTITIKGAVVFTYLPKGTYYLKETTAPKGDSMEYAVNETYVKVIVDDEGVYAFAGTSNDGIATIAGVGTLIDSMSQFGTNNATDNTLTDIIATRATGTYANGRFNWTKDESDTKKLTATEFEISGSTEGEKALEYQEHGEGATGKNAFKSLTGWTRAMVTQDITKYGEETTTVTKQNLGDKDLTHLFSRTMIVQVGDKIATTTASGPSVTKQLVGNWTADKSFTFTLKAEGASAESLLARDENTSFPTTLTLDLSNSTTAEGTFGGTEQLLTFPKQTNTYTFKITENAQADTDNNIYDSTVYYAIASVAKDNDGNWNVTWSYQIEGAESSTESTLTSAGFTNYKAEGYAKLNVQKTLAGLDSWQDGSYSFKLTAVTSGAPMPSADTITINAPSEGLSNTGQFDITYTKEGTYVYDIQEEIPAQDERRVGMTYSAAIYRATVTVSLDSANNKLATSVSYTQLKGDDGTSIAESEQTTTENTPTFTNTYDSTKATWIPRIQKTYTDKSEYYPLTDAKGNFSFTLEAMSISRNDESAVEEGKTIPMPAGAGFKQGTGTHGEGSTYTATLNNATGLVQMPVVSFSDAGYSYTYELREEQGTLQGKGMSYDDSYYVVTVKVSNTTEGNLIAAEVSYQKMVKNKESGEYVASGESFPRGTTPGFENTYDPKLGRATAQFAVSKQLIGRAWDDDDSQGFTFTLKAGDNNAGVDTPMPASETVTIYKNTENHKASFGEITYIKPGTYYYTITEKTDRRYLNWDTSVYSVKVVVTLDVANETLKAETTMSKMARNNSDPTESNTSTPTAAFVNTYEAPKEAVLEGSVNLRVEKTVEGDEWNELTPKESFTFKIETYTGDEKEEGPLPTNETIELSPSKAGETVTGYFGDITFDSNYIGTLEPGDSKVFQYKITEVVPTTQTTNMTYDASAYIVTVTVTLDENEKSYVATSTMTKDGKTVKAAEFTNKYKEPEEVTLTGSSYLNVSKTYQTKDGAASWPTDEKFTFQLSSVTGRAPLPAETTVTLEKPTDGGSTATGSFGDIVFDEVGKYNYTISEVSETKTQYVTYDTSVYDVTVIVTANMETMKLETSVTYKKRNSSETISNYTASFTNVYYKPEKIDLSGEDNLKVSKALVDSNGTVVTWRDSNLFEFELTPGSYTGSETVTTMPMPEDAITIDGKQVSTVMLTKNKQSGNFGDIPFTATGTYTYYITEKDLSTITDPSDASRTITRTSTDYDKSQYLVTVVVSHNTGDSDYTVTSTMTKVKDKDGTDISSPITVDNNIASFTNTYTAPEPRTLSNKITVQKYLSGRSWNDSDSYTFELTARDNAPLPADTRVTVTKDSQTGTFGDIEYTVEGTYYYDIKEVIPENKEDNMTYDTEGYTVMVVVEPNDEESELEIKNVVYYKENGTRVSNASFTNTYKDPKEPTPGPTSTPTPEPTSTPTPSPTSTPTPEPTPTPSTETPSTPTTETPWDDGGPFTTDECGVVYDRWGNKIYEPKACAVGGYNLVNTGDK